MADDPGSTIKRSATSPQDAPRVVARNTLLSILAGIACVLAVFAAWAYWPTLGGVGIAWLSDPDYTHGFFVIPISLWLLWLRREQAPELGLKIDWRGLSLLLLAGAIRYIAGRFYVLQLDAWSIPLWVGGIVWLLLGWSTFRWALPSIAFLWFATPLPGTIEIILSTPLQQFAASCSAWVLRLIGQPALVEGTTILLDDQLLDVERACSGLRMFYGIFALAVACIAIARPPRWKAVLVLFAAIPVAVTANVVRIAVTGLLMRYFSDDAAKHFSHDLAGLVMIPLAVTLFLLFLVLLGHVVDRLRDPGGVAWLIKWCVGGVVLAAGILVWGRHQEARALSTLLDTANHYESQKQWPKTIQYLSRYIRAVPDDLDTYTHLARLYQTYAGSYQDQLRAVELMSTAWRNQPKNEDLGLSAIQIALQIQDFDEAIPLSAEMLAKATQPSTRSQATKLRAAALYSYLLSDKNRGDHTWNDVREALEQELKLPDYEVAHAMMLADIYRGRPIAIKSEDREKLAIKLLDRAVTERAQEPMAWLARFRYRATAKTPDPEKIKGDLTQAVELAKKQPLNPASATVLVTAAAYKQEHADPKEAAALLKQAIGISPQDSRAYLMLADLQRTTHTKESADEAIGILRKGIAATGTNNPSLSLPLSLPLAFLLAESGKIQEAESTISPIEALLPQLVGRDRGNIKLGVGLVRSQILFSRDGAQAAITNLRRLLDDPDVRMTEQRAPEMLAKSYGFLGQLYSSLGLSDLALDACRQAIRIQPANTEWQIQSAALSQQSGDLDSADRDYRAFVQKGQASPGIRAALVEIEIKRQLQLSPQDRDWATAKSMLLSAQQAGAANVPVRLLAAEILASSGERDKAEQSIVKLSQESPQDPSIWRTLTVLRLQRSDFSGALEAVDKFVAVTDQPIDANSLRAGILASSGKADEAVKSLSEVVEKTPAKDIGKGALALGQLLMQVGKPADARSTLEKAHEKDPKDLQVVDALANSAFMAQDWKALEKYETWLNTIEGNDGTLWRAYRAQRMLAATQSVDDKGFQEAAALIKAIGELRPHWSKAHFLQGEIAYRTNRADTAAAEYERAWELGGRGVLLADRLIDSLTQQGRLADAGRYVAQLHDYLMVSQGLFDRAIPYLAQGSDRQEMVHTAQQWALQRPNDPEAHLRLGRVLLLLSDSSSGDQKAKYDEQSKTEFKRAIELSPNDVRPWATIVTLYSESHNRKDHDHALHVLKDFTKQTTFKELERNFVAGQLYELLKDYPNAQVYYNQAATFLEANPKTAGGSRVLGRVARFYLLRVPPLAELFARRALTLEPANPDAKLVLLYVLANRTDTASAQEGLRLLDQAATKEAIEPAVDLRYRAAFLSRRGGADDVNSAIELLRRSNSQSREDKLLLARLYEKSGQAAPALDLLQQLVRAPNANAAELADFLQFWQQNFVANATGKGPVQFAGQAREAYERLGELPGQLPERLRWQLREKTARKSTDAHAVKDECMPIVSEILMSPAAKKLKDNEQKQLVQLMLIVLLQEKRDECAAQLVASPPNGLPPTDLAIWLCHAYVAVPPTKDSAPKQLETLDTLLAANGKNAGVIQAVGDCEFMEGEYQKAAEAYQRVLELRPEERMARNNLALALVELQKTAEARQVLAVALKTSPTDADLLDTQAAIDMIEKHSDQAIPVLEKLVEQNPESPVLRFHLAVAYDDTKDKNRARESFFAATVLGVQQRVLSPRDKKVLEDMKTRYMATDATTADDRSANDSQASN
jgi:exosortase